MASHHSRNEKKKGKKENSSIGSSISIKELKKQHSLFNVKTDYLSKIQCTSILFGQEKVSQRCFVCPICDLNRDQKICKYCYDECHQYCRDHEPPNSDKLNEELNELKAESISCYCGLHLKHIIFLPPKKELFPCNMLQLDQVLNAKSCWCHTHSMQVCCICLVTCHKKCDVIYENGHNVGRCNCKTEFHSGFNELALTFPLNDYKSKTGISVWPIQILNILFSTKNVFQKMSELFIETMNNTKSEIDESFFPLLELFSNTLNRKFKTFYYDSELLNMFNYQNLITFMFRLPMNNPKTLLVKFRLLFIILFIHLKRDYAFIKTLTSIDFMSIPMIERFKYKTILNYNSEMTEELHGKYGKKNDFLIKLAIEEVCTLMSVGMDYLSIEDNQDEFEIGLKYLCFLLKRMVFTNSQLEELIKSLYYFYDKFFEYLTGGKSNIYSLLSIFFTLIEIFYMIAVSYNDNAIQKALESNRNVEEFIHHNSESGSMLFKMVIKSSDIFTKHYSLLQKIDSDCKSSPEKKREAKRRRHLIRMQEKIESTTTGVKNQLPENGGLVVEKIITIYNETLKIFALADNNYYQQINQLSKAELISFYLFKLKIKKKTFGNWFSIMHKRSKSKEEFVNPILLLKSNIERLLHNLFTGSYNDSNLRVGDNILKEMDAFVQVVNQMMNVQEDAYNLNSRKYTKAFTQDIPSIFKSNKDNDDSNVVRNKKIEYYTSRVIARIKSTFKFVSLKAFKFHKEQFVDTLILYSLDETITKLLIYFSNRDFPNLLSYDLVSEILNFLSLYLTHKNGIMYFLLGKNLTRLCKVLRRYSCLKSGKNISIAKHRTMESNLPYVEKAMKFLYILGKGVKAYDIGIRNHKIIQRLQRNILEHLEVFSQTKEMSHSLILILKRHICLALKFFNLFANDYEYEEFEEIKLRVMILFSTSQLKLADDNGFVSIFEPIIAKQREEDEEDEDVLIKDQESSKRKEKNSSQSYINTSGLLTQKAFNYLNESGRESLLSKHTIRTNYLVPNTNRSEQTQLDFSNNKQIKIQIGEEKDEEKTILESQITTKLYYAFFDLITKNTFYVFQNSLEETLYQKMFQFNNIAEMKPIFMMKKNKLFSLGDRKVLLAFIRTMAFLERLNKVDLFKKSLPLTNQEYKVLIYHHLVHIEGLELSEDFNIEERTSQVSTEELAALTKKMMSVECIEKVIEIFAYEVSIYPLQLANSQGTAIEEYTNELVFGIKFISDWFYFSKDIVNRLILQFYILSKEFISKSRLIIKTFSDMKEKGVVELEDYYNEDNAKYKTMTSKSFDIFNKDVLYKFICEEIEIVFKETAINEKCSLRKYLDVFDNMSEANFTPFSLIETYDYEYFYEEDAKGEEDEISKDKLQNQLTMINEEYIAQFINIRSTTFYKVITSISNDSIRIDYRKKIVGYFHAFLNSTEAYMTFKMETLMCIIDKMLFYDGEEMQGKFDKMRSDKFFFPNVNLKLHENVILTITSSKNTYAFKPAMQLISLTKLTIQFLQLLGEGFNTDYHDNIFRLQRDIVVGAPGSDSDATDDDDEGDDDQDANQSITHNNTNTFPNKLETNALGSLTSRNNDPASNIPALSHKTMENKLLQLDETIYHSLIMNLKRSYNIMDIGKEINAEMPYDKLIVLTTNIIDFLIEYIQTTEDKEEIIIESISNLFFGQKQSSSDSYYTKMEKKGLLNPSVFTRIASKNEEEYPLRRKMICYVKMKYIQLLISYLQTGFQTKMVDKLIERRCSTIELYNELLYHFNSMLMQIRLKDPNAYATLSSKTSDSAFADALINIYVYQRLFIDMIEFPLCTKLYILIKTFEELYHQTQLSNHFEKLELMGELNDKNRGANSDDKDNIGLNSSFSRQIHLFFEKIILKVEIKNNRKADDHDNDKAKHEGLANNLTAQIMNNLPKIIASLSGSNAEGGDKTNEVEEEDEGGYNEPPQRNIEEEPDTKLSFFVRPYLTFRLSKQSMNNFEQKVDRTNATSKFVEMINFADYSLLEMVVNEHLIGNSSIKNFFSNITYNYIEIINYLIVILHNSLLIYHYYRSPDTEAKFYDVIDKTLMYHIFPENFYIALIQTAFLGLTLLNWIYFKFPLCYQYNIMKRYRKNFVFRKKGQGANDTISNTIIQYFQDSTMSPYSVIFDKNRDIGIFSALYVGVFDALIFNREICVFIYTIIFNTLYIKFEASMWLVIPMIFIANINVTLFDIFKAIKMKFVNMILVLLFVLIIGYIFMWFTFFYMEFLFDFDEILNHVSHSTITEAFCKSSIQCFLFIITEGLRQGGGIGESLPVMSFRADPGFFIARFFYDMLFYIFIIQIMFNVFMGIIVDTFAELRDINWHRENDMHDVCYICQLSRDDCLTKNIEFNAHVASDHYVWNYVYYLVYLHISNPNDFNSIENCVWEKLEEQDFSWIPIATTDDD